MEWRNFSKRSWIIIEGGFGLGLELLFGTFALLTTLTYSFKTLSAAALTLGVDVVSLSKTEMIESVTTKGERGRGVVVENLTVNLVM